MKLSIFSLYYEMLINLYIIYVDIIQNVRVLVRWVIIRYT